jgi:hypothetical protein
MTRNPYNSNTALDVVLVDIVKDDEYPRVKRSPMAMHGENVAAGGQTTAE